MLKIKGITQLKYFAKGKRGIVYTGLYKGKKVVIKTKRPESKAEGRIENEGFWLNELNKYKIGPKLINATKDYLVCEFIEGETFFNILEHKTLIKDDLKKIIRDVLYQCFVLDKLKVDKKEMHHPIKHIIVTKELKAKMIDFERCHVVKKAKNVTQFAVFLIRSKNLLENYNIMIDREKMIGLLKDYKKEQTKENFSRIINVFS
jgi:putative serine/threonine protein kinase